MDSVERFNESLNRITKHLVSRQDAGEAFHNLAGFMSLLSKINEREKVAQDD